MPRSHRGRFSGGGLWRAGVLGLRRRAKLRSSRNDDVESVSSSTDNADLNDVLISDFVARNVTRSRTAAALLTDYGSGKLQAVDIYIYIYISTL